MSEIGEKRMFLTAVVLIVGLVAFILHARLGLTNAGQDESAVRMAVDPTVLPPIKVEKPQASSPKAAPAKAGADATSSPESVAEAPASEDKTAEPADTEDIVVEVVEKPAKPSGSSTEGGIITNVGLKIVDSQMTVSVQCDRPVGDTTYMNLNNPKRLVIDLRQPWTVKTGNVVRPSGGPVKYIVIGEHADRTRLVVHFRTAFKGRLSPRFKRTGNSLIVTTQLP